MGDMNKPMKVNHEETPQRSIFIQLQRDGSTKEAFMAVMKDDPETLRLDWLMSVSGRERDPPRDPRGPHGGSNGVPVFLLFFRRIHGICEGFLVGVFFYLR